MIPSFNTKKLEKLAKQYRLRFVILHGSHATGKEHSESDVDIAFLPEGHMDTMTSLELFGPFSLIFSKKNEYLDLDLKSMEGADPLFRYEVVRDGVLLYGDPTDYEEYKAISARMYDDARSLFDLERVLVHKYQRHLNTTSHAQ
ncbi:MAG: nucleotidyltransferase domain-containing protein [Candidatus Uhrbacteria bacterium]|nr:nucleotidyltransferase domain-containing protein [Candidatus Uhrbacteria bacterium]